MYGIIDNMSNSPRKRKKRIHEVEHFQDAIDFEEFNRENTEVNAVRTPDGQKEVSEYFRTVKKAPFQSPAPRRDPQQASTSLASNNISTMASGSQAEVNPGLKEAAGVAAFSGDSINPGFTYIKRDIDQKLGTVTYRNVIMCNTWGYAYTVLDRLTNGYGQLTTPLAAIPANVPAFYMSRTEWSKLPAAARAVSCKIKVTPKGFRTSFATQQTDSSYSNSNHTLFGVHAIGLNKNNFGRMYEIAGRNATKPMLITETKDCVGDTLEKIMWGQNLIAETQATEFLKELPMCIGVHRSLPYYWNAHIYTLKKDKNSEHMGWLLLRESITEWDFAGHVNKPILNYEYKFNHGLLKSREGYMPRNHNGDKTYNYGGTMLGATAQFDTSVGGQIERVEFLKANKKAWDIQLYGKYRETIFGSFW